jgi:hypothetical protein
MPFLMDIWHAIHGILTTSDLITLGVMVVIALAAGFMMHSFSSVVTTTVIALVAFALVGYVRAVLLGGQNASAYAMTDWQAFQNLHMLQLLAYALAFAIVITVAHAARTLIFGRA